MAESIPEDIIIDILLRLPAKSLMRFKCVCKRWRSLISDPGFVKSHLQRLKAGDLIPSQRIIIGSVLSCLDGSTCCPLATIDCEALDDASDGRAVLPHTIRPFLQPQIVGSSDGLHELFHGFGYDPQSDDYKIVEGMVDDYDEDWEVEIFSLKSGSWTNELLDFEEESHLVVSGKRGVYWNGALHWYVRRWISPTQLGDAIMSFDLSEEKFHRKLSVPEVDGDRVFVGLGIHGASLFIFSSGPDTCIDAWITDEYGRGGSWTKWLSVDCMPASRNIPLAYTRSGKILFQKDNERVILFNPEDNTYKDYPIGKDGFIYCAFYLETLISPYLGSEPSGI
ncbi:hypothetical protein NL676_021377 [Syzygium grande]|nr:hypothetical protein NL676_021377 [Syzygium grande]